VKIISKLFFGKTPTQHPCRGRTTEIPWIIESYNKRANIQSVHRLKLNCKWEWNAYKYIF